MSSINSKKNISHFDNMHVCGKDQPQGIAPTNGYPDPTLMNNDTLNNCKKHPLYFGDIHVGAGFIPALYQHEQVNQIIGQPQGIAPTGGCHHNHRLINDNIIKKNDRSNNCKKHPLCFGDIPVGAGLAPALFQKLIIKQQLGL